MYRFPTTRIIQHAVQYSAAEIEVSDYLYRFNITSFIFIQTRAMCSHQSPTCVSRKFSSTYADSIICSSSFMPVADAR